MLCGVKKAKICRVVHIELNQLVYENVHAITKVKDKGKVFPYSLPSVGPGADPGVQAVSPQVT